MGRHLTHQQLYLLFSALFILSISGCEKEAVTAPGTLERERITYPSPAFETITNILVTEGKHVKKGDLLLTFDTRKIDQQILEKNARLTQAEWKLKELEQGPLPQTIKEVKARLAAAEANHDNALANYTRQQKLFKANIASKETLDNARSVLISSREKVNEISENLEKLTTGTRLEQLRQAEAEVQALKAGLEYLNLMREDYTLKAAEDGLIEKLIYEKGSRVTTGTPVCIMLVGKKPYARVYIPELYKASMKTGGEFKLRIDGLEGEYLATLRRISSEAVFSPYFSLTERDSARLTYLAEFDLENENIQDLTAGTIVRLILEMP